MTLALSDAQLRLITAVGHALAVEKRPLFLGRVAAHLRLAGRLRHASDEDIEEACHAALTGLVQEPAA